MRPQAPQAPPSLVPEYSDEKLRAANWYWGRITREEAKNVLYGKPDGSFLVRDALSIKGEYTLTLMKDGNEKLIKICHMNGKYGFIESNLFDSVVDMVEHYKVNSLKVYNKTLDIMLSNPVVRLYDEDSQPHGDMRSLSNNLIHVHRLLLQQEQSLDQKKTQFDAIREELQEKKRHQTVFSEGEKMFRGHIMLIESFIKSLPGNSNTIGGTASGGNNNNAATGNKNGNNAAANNSVRQQEQEHLQENLERLNEHLAEMHAKMDRLNHYIEAKKEEEQLLERQINSAKPEIQSLQMRKDKYIERLKEFNLCEEDLVDIYEMGFDKWQLHYEKISNLPHRDESLWFLTDSKRSDAEELLRGAPTGTFLIRVREAGHYALTIVCNAGIQHCIIYETESGFGFAAPYNIYPTLKKLVEHYATNSLEEHNDTLTTTLRIPVMYWHQDKQHVLQQLQEELDYEPKRLALEATLAGQMMPPPPPPPAPQHASSAPIPMMRARDVGHDVVDAVLAVASSETETPPPSISPSNFSISQ